MRTLVHHLPLDQPPDTLIPPVHHHLHNRPLLYPAGLLVVDGQDVAVVGVQHQGLACHVGELLLGGRGSAHADEDLTGRGFYYLYAEAIAAVYGHRLCE